MAAESSIEQYLRREVEKRGGVLIKWVAPGFTGVPDRIALFPGGVFFLVETKAPGAVPSKRQAFVHRQFAKLGHTVHIIDSFTAAEKWLNAYAPTSATTK